MYMYTLLNSPCFFNIIMISQIWIKSDWWARNPAPYHEIGLKSPETLSLLREQAARDKTRYIPIYVTSCMKCQTNE